MKQNNVPILITGATGFLGSYLLRELLSAGYNNIKALRRTNSRMDLVSDVKNQIQWVEGDIRDIDFLAEAMSGIETVFHAAALVSFLPKDKKRLYQINTEGTANIVNAALSCDVKELMYVSSVAALGRSKEDQPITEETNWDESPNNTTYAHSKYLAELEVWRGQEEGLQVAVINPSIILGLGRKGEGTMGFFEQIKKGMPYYPAGTTGFVDVLDTARFMRMLYESNHRGERFILSAENLPFGKFFEMIAQAMGTPPPKRKVTPLLKELAWRLEWLRSKILRQDPFITRETVNTAMSTWRYDNSKSLSYFPNFSYTPIQKTIERIVAIYSNQSGLG